MVKPNPELVNHAAASLVEALSEGQPFVMIDISVFKHLVAVAQFRLKGEHGKNNSEEPTVPTVPIE